MREGLHILIEDGRIREISETNPITTTMARTLDLRGLTVTPGCIDAHFHAYAADTLVDNLDAMPMSLLACHAVRQLESTLLRGFTSVREAGGGDFGLAIAISATSSPGPVSSTPARPSPRPGGYGDLRPADRVDQGACGYRGALTQVVDGPDEMRTAVREELRRGAHQIALLVSGGSLSPTHPPWMQNLSDDEIRVAVDATRSAPGRSHLLAGRSTGLCTRHSVATGCGG